MAIKHATPVTVSLSALQTNSIPFSTLLDAFGPSSLGILVVTDLPPQFAGLRSKVLSNASRLAALGPEKLERLTNADAKYLVGWSHGKESLREGVVDDKKGSYYINCSFYNSTPNSDSDSESSEDPLAADRRRFPGFDEYTAPSVWPAAGEIEGFREDGEALIRLIIDTAVLVARACDRYAEQEIAGYETGYLERVVKGSRTSKARLLHYFPTEVAGRGIGVNGHDDGGSRMVEAASAEKGDTVDDTWCTTHLDHGCLTGLTSAMFVDEAAHPPSTTTTATSHSPSTSSPSPLPELPTSPDPTSGLYILSRTGEIHKVAIPRDSLAFQTGETLQLITQGRFKAVPHFVKGVEPANVADKAARIARNTLAVFTQPNLDEVVDLQTGLTFGEFARGVVKKNTTG